MGADDVEGDFSQEGDVLRAVVLTVSCGVLAEVDVEDPVQFVFDVPMGSDGFDEGVW